MKYATVLYRGEPIPVVLSDDVRRAIPINDVLGTSYPDLISFISKNTEEQIDSLRKAAASDGGIDMSQVKLVAPIQKPIHDILCVGVNYVSHLEETKQHFDGGGKFQSPEKTVFFSKRTVRIVGPDESILAHEDLDEKLDYEVELAVILGGTIDSSVDYDGIADRIFGYSVFNDVSARELQARHLQWYVGKSLDTFCAMGPWIVSADEIAMNEGLDIESRVNGEVRQHSNTKYMRRNVSDLLYDFSRGITLEAGDILATGTPAGVGQGFTPPRFMKKGDVVEVEVERIGTLRNTVV